MILCDMNLELYDIAENLNGFYQENFKFVQKKLHTAAVRNLRWRKKQLLKLDRFYSCWFLFLYIPINVWWNLSHFVTYVYVWPSLFFFIFFLFGFISRFLVCLFLFSSLSLLLPNIYISSVFVCDKTTNIFSNV